jgi:BirA family transcriptional regulator, biotin operon repressor / biotin---[acetyl-CoA-carboxylase] ligase
VARPGSPLTTARFGQLASLLPDCPSTQDIARAAAATGAPEGFIAVADHQTAGRGRRGRTWSDAPGQALMFSVLLRPEAPTAELSPLALVLGIAVAEALPVPARLRWPNDVVVDGAKVAGILTELETPAGGGRYVVAGIGINVNAPPDDLPETDRLPATSLLAETGTAHDRLALLHAVTDRIQATYREWEALGFAALFDRFRALDDLAGREVVLQLGDGIAEGVAAGVDAAGRLVLELADGSERRLDAGEVVRVDDDPTGR